MSASSSAKTSLAVARKKDLNRLPLCPMAGVSFCMTAPMLHRKHSWADCPPPTLSDLRRRDVSRMPRNGIARIGPSLPTSCLRHIYECQSRRHEPGTHGDSAGGDPARSEG